MSEVVRIVRVEGGQAIVVPSHPEKPADPPQEAAEPALAVSWLELLPREKLSDLVRQIVLKNLSRNEGNRTHTARGLGISLRGIRNMINEFEAAGHHVPESRYVGELRRGILHDRY